MNGRDFDQITRAAAATRLGKALALIRAYDYLRVLPGCLEGTAALATVPD